MFLLGERKLTPLLVLFPVIETLNTSLLIRRSVDSQKNINVAFLLACYMTVSHNMELCHFIVLHCLQAKARNCLFGTESLSSDHYDFLVLLISRCEVL